jgi:addiction module HigA family antidote
MYEQYLSMPAVPAGIILKRILQKENLSQKELAKQTGIYPQRINDFILGKRKFTAEMALKIDMVFGFSESGFLYKVQTNNEVFLLKEILEKNKKPNLKKLRKSIFWEAENIDNINWLKNDKWAITRVFEYGKKEEIEEIIRFYGREKVATVLDEASSNTWKKKERIRNRKLFKI